MDKYPNYRLSVTGHSLGAALAILAGIELRLMGLDVLVVTLATPRIGDKNFASYVDDLFNTKDVTQVIDKEKSFDNIGTALIRMIHLHDVVPYLPPTRYFRHSGYEYFLAAEGVSQTPQTIKRQGTTYLEDEPQNYLEVLPNFRRLDHANYFLPVSHCI
ncbi:alpha/beta-hydrolase [Metschnikowia bicuspidata var. bicuspidata NRRL YB-4993]|uniref:triacylglycerol lipase n=1 Tax=Metschnikowia bicuspidata var. bicuspidata NRRL YB-4993 TaxID=869754 RepID=A0A1A0H7Q3_9ASCO|nr:alpha/beta-hydrolase [Metschnikowia bicuspidata var. bicuspidata NRRL YB-4993]OBA19922.1 alpha/beta-hydrolase [Metschnikowia bicuspidata var. bicuspidata NRRL YB-4993]